MAKKEIKGEEAIKLQQELRSSFFYRRRAALKEVMKRVKEFEGESLRWSHAQFGISEKAWKIVSQKDVKPWWVFCHPKAIGEEPSLYYRSIAVLSQKGVHRRLSFGVQALEEGRSRTLLEKHSLELSKLFNHHISAIVESDPDFDMEDLWLVAAMNFGTQINGSWRNEIGVEGTRRVKELILRHLFERGVLEKAKLSDGTEQRFSSSLLKPDQVDLVRAVKLKNSFRVVFGSEPDIAVYPPKRRVPCAAIEVKAGIDPAGALERYGAVKKSFDGVLQRNKRAITIYLASALTKAVKKRIEADRAVTHHFDLTDVFLRPEIYEKFWKLLEWILHLGGDDCEAEGLHTD